MFIVKPKMTKEEKKAAAAAKAKARKAAKGGGAAEEEEEEEEADRPVVRPSPLISDSVPGAPLLCIIAPYNTRRRSW